MWDLRGFVKSADVSWDWMDEREDGGMERILIVEDDEKLRKELAFFFES